MKWFAYINLTFPSCRNYKGTHIKNSCWNFFWANKMVIRIRYTTSQRAKMQQIWICFRKYRKHAHQSYLWKLWVFPVCSCVTELRPLAWLALDGLLNLRGRSKLMMKQTSNDDNVLLHGGPSCSYSQIWESLHAWVRASKCLDSKMKAALLSCGY